MLVATSLAWHVSLGTGGPGPPAVCAHPTTLLPKAGLGFRPACSDNTRALLCFCSFPFSFTMVIILWKSPEAMPPPVITPWLDRM